MTEHFQIYLFREKTQWPFQLGLEGGFYGSIKVTFLTVVWKFESGPSIYTWGGTGLDVQRCECVSSSRNAVSVCPAWEMLPPSIPALVIFSLFMSSSDFKRNKTNTRHAASGMADLIAIRNCNQAILTWKCIVIIPTRKEIVNSYDLALFGSFLLMKNALAESIITSETNSVMMVLWDKESVGLLKKRCKTFFFKCALVHTKGVIRNGVKGGGLDPTLQKGSLLHQKLSATTKWFVKKSLHA